MSQSGLSEADVSAIRKASEAYVKAALARDWDTWMKISTNDAVFMPPGSPFLDTREKIRAFVDSFPPMSSFTATPLEFDGHADIAFVRGQYAFTAKPEGGDTITDSGKYIELWKKQVDGSWKIFRDIWNSDLAPWLSR